MSNSLEVLSDHKNRNALLLAEVVAWLHDMGKCDEGHIQQEASDYIGPPKPYEYKTKHSHRIGSQHLEILGERVPLKQLIEEGLPSIADDTSKPWLVRTLGYCHSAAHTEKEEVYCLLKQTIADTRGSSPFGYETEHLVGLKDQLDKLPFSQISNRTKIKPSIEKTFSHTCGDTRRPINAVTLWSWSSIVAAFYKAALAFSLLEHKDDPSKLHWRLFSVRVDSIGFLEGSTRISDLLARRKLITDALDRVSILLEETYPLGTEVYRDEDGSVFIVPDIDNLLTLENGHGEKLSDLILHKFSEGTVEKKHSLRLGGELTPSLEQDKVPWHWDRSITTHQLPLPINEHIVRTPSSRADLNIVKDWWQSSNIDICTVCRLRPQGWGTSDNKIHYELQMKGKFCEYRPNCQTCKAIKRKICGICEQRRENRSKRWAGELGTSIWIDEIADTKGRLALIVGRFDLDTWLNGSEVFYPANHMERKLPPKTILKVRTLNAPLVEGQTLTIRRNNYTWHQSLEALISLKDVEKKQIPNTFRDNRLYIEPINASVEVIDIKKLPNGRYCILVDGTLPGLNPRDSCRIRGHEFQVSGNASQIETASDGAIKVVENQILHPGCLIVEQSFDLYAMVESHTPARLHHLWETTQNFWRDIESNFNTTVDEVSPRLRIRGVFKGIVETLGISHTYELNIGNVNLSITYVADGEFLTVDNLQRTSILLNAPKESCSDYSSAAIYIQSLLRQARSMDLEEPAGYGNSNKPLGKLQITKVVIEPTPYVPAISLLAEPRTFMAIVPADKAIKVVNAIWAKYEEEMGKVRNRLPLILSIVFAERRTPLPAILDAGRRMLKQSTGDETWMIDKVDHHVYPQEIELTRTKDEQTITVKVPTLMGDGKTEDLWYPYWQLNNAVLSSRTKQFMRADDKLWVHVHDLREHDEVHFKPSRFDFEFLDTAARRFEISYEKGKRRGSTHPARPYYLEQLNDFTELWAILSNGLSTSQIHNLIEAIETKRLEWEAKSDDLTFKKMICMILNNADWGSRRPSPEKLDCLEQAALSGQLADVFELYVRILKKSSEVDKAEATNDNN